MGVWYRTIATSASAALTFCWVLAGEVVAAPAPSTTPEAEVQVQGQDEIQNRVAPTAVPPSTGPDMAEVSTADDSIVESAIESAEPAESAAAEQPLDVGTESVAIAPGNAATPTESLQDSRQAAEPDDAPGDATDDATLIPTQGEPAPVEQLDSELEEDGIPTADVLQDGNLEPLESNPNPLQYPTLPEEVRLILRQPITLEQALELARRNSRVLENARLALEQSQHSLRAAIAARYPQIDLDATLINSLTAANRLTLLQANDATRRAGGNDLVEDPADRNADTTAYTLTLQLTYNIYSSGQRLNQIRAAQAQVKSSEYALEAAFEDVRFNVTDAYYTLQQESEQLRIDQASVGFRERSVKDAQALETAGLGTRFEVLQAEVELANDRQLVEQTRSRLIQARRELARQLSLPEVIDIATEDPVEKVGDWTLGLEESIIAAYRNRAELYQQLAQADVAEAQRRAFRGQDGPQLNAVLQYDLFDNLDPEDNFGPVYGYSAALQFSWNLFDGGGDRARANQQDALRRQAENQFAIQREAVRFDVEQSYADLIANEASIRTALQAIEAAQEEVRLARLRFTAGVGTQTDRLNAETRFIRARGNVLSAILGYNRAVSSLIRSVSNVAPGTVVPPEEPVTLPELQEDPEQGASGSAFDVQGDRIIIEGSEIIDDPAE
ncbi:MAG: TolC family protein [Cyanobacteria bacterium P01_H01_bin.130]